MNITIISVVKRKDGQSERLMLSTPHSLTVTFGRWTEQELATYMVDYTMNCNIRQLSREQLGRLARDIVYAVVFDPIWQEEFAPFAVEVNQFKVDYFPRILAEGGEEYASWNWGNKWSLLGEMSPSSFRNFAGTPLGPEDRFSPELFTFDELSAALHCSVGLMTAYTRGLLRGQMDWSELDIVHESLQRALPRLYNNHLLPAIASYHPIEEWRQQVVSGDTKLGYEAWLTHQFESKEPVQ